MRFIDRTGQVFNHLKFIKVVERGNKLVLWEVECLLCHAKKVLPGIKVAGGHTKSCGCLQSSQRQSPRDYCIKRIFDTYKYAAKKRKILFDISLEQLKSFLFQPCYYCGNVESNTYKAEKRMPNHTLKYNGIDRLDNSKGYTLDNIVACCKLCNRMKMTIRWDDFLKQVFKIYKQHAQSKLKLERI